MRQFSKTTTKFHRIPREREKKVLKTLNSIWRIMKTSVVWKIISSVKKKLSEKYYYKTTKRWRPQLQIILKEKTLKLIISSKSELVQRTYSPQNHYQISLKIQNKNKLLNRGHCSPSNSRYNITTIAKQRKC